MRNLRLLIAYDGTDFHGWQRQPKALTVQECLESAIERILGEKAQVYGSGRTDAGVHALNQVANFKTDCRIPCENLVKALNDALPPTVRIKDAHEVPAQFHARYDVRSKTYRYRILQAPVCSPFLWRFVWHYPFPLDSERMAEAAKLFEGEHDFTSFAAADGSAAEESCAGAGADRDAPRSDSRSARPVAQALLPVSPLLGDESTQARVPVPQVPAEGRIETAMVRRIFTSRILLRPRTSMLIYEVSGNGFLHHMVRNMVGTLVEVGRGKLEPGDVLRILKARDRSLAGPTAPAQGLCLVRVEY
jgi:tRNA pseudouridine38-40 synthase